MKLGDVIYLFLREMKGDSFIFIEFNKYLYN